MTKIFLKLSPYLYCAEWALCAAKSLAYLEKETHQEQSVSWSLRQL